MQESPGNARSGQTTVKTGRFGEQCSLLETAGRQGVVTEGGHRVAQEEDRGYPKKTPGAFRNRDVVGGKFRNALIIG